MSATACMSSTEDARSHRARRRRSGATSTWPRPISAPAAPRWRSPMSEPALELDAVDVRYGAVPAVRELTLDVARGEIVGLIGPNGAGKSTTLHAIMGVVPVAGGEIRLAGRSLRRRRPEDVARAGVALVPEGRRIFPHLTVAENL